MTDVGGLPVQEIDDQYAAYLVSRLPENVREKLREGPVPGDDTMDCRVCEALELLGDPPEARYSGPAVALDTWHDMYLQREAEGLPELIGKGAECYRRCCVIYAAAGWEGEVPDA